MRTLFFIPKTKYIIYVILMNSILTLLTVLILNIVFVQEDTIKAKRIDEQGNRLYIVLTNNLNDFTGIETLLHPENAFNTMKFDNTKDFVCGMPLTAGVGDTANYKGKVYGFCAKGCKDEFKKNPSAYLSK